METQATTTSTNKRSHAKKVTPPKTAGPKKAANTAKKATATKSSVKPKLVKTAKAKPTETSAVLLLPAPETQTAPITGAASETVLVCNLPTGCRYGGCLQHGRCLAQAPTETQAPTEAVASPTGAVPPNGKDQAETQAAAPPSGKAAEADTPDTKPTVVAAVDDRPALDLYQHGQFPGGAYFRANQFKPLVNYRDWNDPEDIKAVEQLALMIYQNYKAGGPGVLVPVSYVPGDYRVGDLVLLDHGETRQRAVLLLEGKEYAPDKRLPARVKAGEILLPAVPVKAGRTDEARHLELLARNTQRPFGPIGLAKWMAKLRDEHGYTEDQIADAAGKPKAQGWVSQILALNKATPKVLEYVRQGLIKPTTVVTVMRDYGERADEFVSKAIQAKQREIRDHRYKDPMLLHLEDARNAQNARSTPTETQSASNAKPAAKSAASPASRVTATPTTTTNTRKRDRPSRAANTAKVSRKDVDRVAGKKPESKVNLTHYQVLLAAVQTAAKHCRDESTRNELNDALVQVGEKRVDFIPTKTARVA